MMVIYLILYVLNSLKFSSVEFYCWYYLNSIDRIMVDGELTLDPEAIAECISCFYRQLYFETVAHRLVLDDVNFSIISEADALWLERPFGPNGFSMAFFQSCWSVLKAEIMEVFQNFHSQAVFEKSLNASFLALIPQKVVAMEVKDFRLISLVGGIYKIISRVLANWFRRVAYGLISNSHNAFVKVRQILDYVLIASKCIDSRLK